MTFVSLIFIFFVLWKYSPSLPSYDKILDILMTEDEMTEREAIDYIEYNIAGSYVGELTPILVRSLDEVEKFIIDKQTKSVFTDKKIDDKEIN